MPGASCIARATMAARSVPLRSLENHLVLAGAVLQPWPAWQHSKRFASEGNRGKALLAGQDAMGLSIRTSNKLVTDEVQLCDSHQSSLHQ
jgi:hypothetical protein